MTTLRSFSAVSVLAAALFVSALSTRAALPEYKLGDVALEDVVTPVTLQVVNPEATDVLRQKVAQQVPSVARQIRSSSADAEAEIRSAISTARVSFLATLQQALSGRAPVSADVGTPAYAATLRDAANGAPKNLPWARLAPLWVRGASDETIVNALLQPLREVMAQPIVADLKDNPLSATLPVLLIPVANASDTPSMQELLAYDDTIPAGKVISLWRARRLVETHFPTDQQEFGRFAAGFVRINIIVAPGLMEILRAKRMDGVTVNDTYEAAQAVVKKGQTIDPKALRAVAAVREKSLIGTLQTKLEQEQSVAGQITRQTKWLMAGLGAMGLALVLILWNLRSRPSNALVAVAPAYSALPGDEQHALPGGYGDGNWRDRAMVAEVKAQRAQEAIRQGALGWMRDKIFRNLFNQRAELLSAQQKAESEMRELEQRLEQLHTPLQERIAAYEKRIHELEQDLIAKGEENRELIGARISVAKQQLNVERGRYAVN